MLDRFGGTKGDKMRRFWIVLLIVATAMMMALPATAKKPPTPDPEPTTPTTYIATIERVNANGIESTCPESVAVTRTDARRGAVTHFESEGAQLNIQAEGLAFEDEPIGECAGDEVWREYFRITFDGDKVAMLWIFDVGIEETIVDIGKKGKTRTEETRTDFRMGGPYDSEEFAVWETDGLDTDGVITTGGVGTFVFVRDDSSGTSILDNGLQTFELEITLTPTP